MRQMLLLISLFVLFVSPGISAQDNTVSVPLRPGEPARLVTEDGVIVELPDGVLYDYQNASISLQYLPQPDVDTGTYRLPGDVFHLDLSNDEVFNGVVTLHIPYDPALLPPDFPESNLFATYFHEGEWIRVRGTVDRENQVIIVETLHNGFWTWALDTVGNISQSTWRFLGQVSDRPQNVDEARALVAQREAEWLASIERLQLSQENLSTALDPRSLLPTVGTFVLEYITLHSSHALVYAVAGKHAILYIAGQPAAIWLGGVTGKFIIGTGVALYTGRVAGETVLGLRAIMLNFQAYARFQEALAILEALENPDQFSFFPEDASYIETFIDLQPVYGSIDWSLTAHTDADAELLLEDILKAAISLPVATEELLPCTVSTSRANSAAVRVGPGTHRTSVTYLPANVSIPVTGMDASGRWWRLDKNIAAPGLLINEAWVAAADVVTSGDCSMASVGLADAPPIIPIVTATPVPPVRSTAAPQITTTASAVWSWDNPRVLFWADQYSVGAGGCTYLRWDMEFIQSAYLSGGGFNRQGVIGFDSRLVCPTSTTTYRMEVNTRVGQRNPEVTIFVTGSPGATVTGAPTVTVTSSATP